MNINVITTWNENMSFESDINGFKVKMDTSEINGGKNLAPSPKPLILCALAGCTGMDVVSLLKKMQLSPFKFEIKTEGIINEQHPQKYNEINILYKFHGEDLDINKIEKAILLSKDKYCGVAATLNDCVKLSYGIEINERFIKTL